MDGMNSILEWVECRLNCVSEKRGMAGRIPITPIIPPIPVQMFSSSDMRVCQSMELQLLCTEVNE